MTIKTEMATSIPVDKDEESNTEKDDVVTTKTTKIANDSKNSKVTGTTKLTVDID